MTPPADLAALIDRAGTVTAYCSCYACKAIAPLILPARLALERVEDVLLKDRGKTNEINILTKENREQAARLARLEEALIGLLACTHGDENMCGCRGIARGYLEGRDESEDTRRPADPPR